MDMRGVEGVAPCGLYCGGCGRHTRGRCKGCRDGGGYNSCKIRKCTTERDLHTCAECSEMEDCRKVDNFVSRIFSLIFKSDRMGNLREIREEGAEKWADRQAVKVK